jgi:hypothetical protein
MTLIPGSFSRAGIAPAEGRFRGPSDHTVAWANPRHNDEVDLRSSYLVEGKARSVASGERRLPLAWDHDTAPESLG